MFNNNNNNNNNDSFKYKNNEHVINIIVYSWIITTLVIAIVIVGKMVLDSVTCATGMDTTATIYTQDTQGTFIPVNDFNARDTGIRLNDDNIGRC